MSDDGYILTPRGYAALLQCVEETKKRLNEAIQAKAQAGAGQDDWHDEGYKLAVTEEMTIRQRLSELMAILQNAEVVTVAEQNESVQIGNGVVVDYEDGSTTSFILDGYLVVSAPGRVSIGSPVGKAVVGLRVGRRATYRGAKGVRTLTVRRILLPSEAEKTLQKKEGE